MTPWRSKMKPPPGQRSAVFLVVHAGSNNTAQVFTTHYSPTGLTGVIGGSVFTLLAFGGFEGAAPLAEEARNPRRTIQRAVLLATLLIGLLYVFTTYAIDVAYGPKGFTAFASETGQASWVGDSALALRDLLVLRVPGHRQLDHRQRQRRGERLVQDRVRDGPDRGVPALPSDRQPAAPVPRSTASWWPSSSPSR